MTMNEHSFGPLLKALLATIGTALEDVHDFWKHAIGGENPKDIDELHAKTEAMLAPDSPDALRSANTLFRALVKMQVILTIMSELHSVDTYMSRQPSTQLLSMLKGPDEMKIIQDLCALQKACVLSNVRLKASMPASQKPPFATAAFSSEIARPISQEVPIDVATATRPNEGDISRGEVAAPAPEPCWPESKNRNAKALRQVLSSIPDSLKAFLHGGHSPR